MCLTATVGCDEVRCIARLANRCGKPATCRLKMSALCRAPTGEFGPATGTSSPVTVGDREQAVVFAEVVCNPTETELTRPTSLSCRP